MNIRTISDDRAGKESELMEKRQEYFLMNRDEKVMLFTSEKNEYGEVLLEEQEVFDISLPPGFEDIQIFIAHRQAPKHRKHILKLLRRAGCEDLEGFLRVSKALSLNDTFWVKPAKSRLCWKEVSLYQNDFNEVIAQIAFDGGDYETDFSSTSPEMGLSMYLRTMCLSFIASLMVIFSPAFL